ALAPLFQLIQQLGQCLEIIWLADVAGMIINRPGKFLPGGGVPFVAGELLRRFGELLPPLVMRHFRPRETDKPRSWRQPILPPKRKERRHQLAAGQIAGRAEDDNRVGHASLLPNCCPWSLVPNQIVIAVKPPSTKKSAPVMKLPPRSDSSNSAAPTSSLGSPNRPIGVCRMIFFTRSGSRILRFCSAGKKPGQSALTRTLCEANSRATFFVRLTTAAFDAE